jgi:hypothetical protein
MGLWGIPDQYMTLFYMTIVLLAAKVSIVAFLVSRIVVERRSIEKTPLYLLYAGTICMLTFLSSRLLYIIFDFSLTKFDTALYTISPSIWIWKVANLVSSSGTISLLWVVERKILIHKFKGMLVIIASVSSAIQFLYPVPEGSLEDFNLISTIGLFGALGVFVIPIVFFALGRTAPGLRRFAWIFSFGVLIYAIGSSGMSQTILDTILSGMDRDAVYILSIGLKIIGLVITTYGLSTIRAINKALIEYYQAKRICIVHRGKIDGPVFMCATCRIFYCIPCKQAIVELENACWNCKAVLEPKKGEIPRLAVDTPNVATPSEMDPKRRQEAEKGKLPRAEGKDSHKS